MLTARDKDISKIMHRKLRRALEKVEAYLEKHPEKLEEKEMLIKRLYVNRLS
jgi:uncharacterized protein YigA (DUF484 family)